MSYPKVSWSIHNVKRQNENCKEDQSVMQKKQKGVKPKPKQKERVAGKKNAVEGKKV